MMLLIFLAIGFAIYYFTIEDKTRSKSTTSPIEMLKRRFVSGEIDEETYKRTMAALTR